MRVSMRSFTVAAAIAAIVSLASLFNVDTAQAQPACVATSVFNNTPCTVNLCMYDAGGVVQCWGIPPGGPTGIVLGGFVPVGVVSAGGNLYPFVAPPNPGCTPCIALRCLTGPSIVTCAIVCYDAPTCTIKISAPCPTPCLP